MTSSTSSLPQSTLTHAGLALAEMVLEFQAVDAEIAALKAEYKEVVEEVKENMDYTERMKTMKERLADLHVLLVEHATTIKASQLELVLPMEGGDRL